MSENQFAIDDVCFVAAKEKYDFIYDGIGSYGFQILIPYKDRNLFLRILREIWFRMRLPKREIWFHKDMKRLDKRVIIVKDSLICTELLEFLKRHYPKSKLIVMYFNRVHTTFSAEEAAKYADELWSFDEEDCRLYHMKHMGYYYFQTYRIQKNPEPETDVVYVGRDKGRARYLLDIEGELKRQGLKTNFRICPDRSFMRFQKSFYKPAIPYGEYLDLLKDTKALLNIMPEGQRSITPRDMEVIFHEVKGITNNQGIRDFPFYHPDRYFVLEEGNLEKIRDFLSTPFPKVEEGDLEPFEFDRMVLSLLNEKENQG